MAIFCRAVGDFLDLIGSNLTQRREGTKGERRGAEAAEDIATMSTEGRGQRKRERQLRAVPVSESAIHSLVAFSDACVVLVASASISFLRDEYLQLRGWGFRSPHVSRKSYPSGYLRAGW